MAGYLKPTSTHHIPVHPSTDGYATQTLVVDKHEFPGSNSKRKAAFLFSHSNGFHKESLHPLMKRFLNKLRGLKQYEQTDITFVSWDARNHGDSARLNDGTFLESCKIFEKKNVLDGITS